MFVRVLYLMAVSVGLLTGSPVERLVAVALAGVLVAHRVLVVVSGHRRRPGREVPTGLSHATAR